MNDTIASGTEESSIKTRLGLASRVGLGLVLAATLAACSGTTASSAPASEPAPASGAATGACADADALKTAVADLKAIDLTSVGTDGLTAAVDKVKAAGATLKSSAGSEVSADVTALEGALTALGTAVGQVGQGEIGAAVEPIQTAIAGVEAATTSLVTTVQTASC